jgi:hypothetical protein
METWRKIQKAHSLYPNQFGKIQQGFPDEYKEFVQNYNSCVCHNDKLEELIIPDGLHIVCCHAPAQPTVTRNGLKNNKGKWISFGLHPNENNENWKQQDELTMAPDKIPSDLSFNNWIQAHPLNTHLWHLAIPTSIILILDSGDGWYPTITSWA